MILLETYEELSPNPKLPAQILENQGPQGMGAAVEVSQPEACLHSVSCYTVPLPFLQALHEYAVWNCATPLSSPTCVILVATRKEETPCPLKSMNGKSQMAKTERFELKLVKERKSKAYYHT